MWVSPLEADDWSEYRDGAFLSRLGLGSLREKLALFWPNGGPQWDALGRSTDGGVVLVEAKSHAAELTSSCGAIDERSRECIGNSLNDTKGALGAAAEADWMNRYYQYANRLAHLQFLHSHNVNAILAFVYFVSDTTMPRPETRVSWDPALKQTYQHLGLTTTPTGVCNVFIDVEAVPPRAAHA
jgi:hypothetical protein